MEEKTSCNWKKSPPQLQKSNGPSLRYLLHNSKIGFVPVSYSGFGPPSADLDPPTELSENIILNVLVEIAKTFRFSAY